MEKQKGYIVLEVGFEYNDEYYSTGNYGTTYEAPKKVFLNEETAMTELRQKTFEKLRGEDLGGYGENGLESICKKNMQDEFSKICQEEFDIDTDEYYIEIPKTATDEQLSKLVECLKINFFELIEVDLD